MTNYAIGNRRVRTPLTPAHSNLADEGPHTHSPCGSAGATLDAKRVRAAFNEVTTKRATNASPMVTFLSAQEAANLIPDGGTVAATGFTMMGVAEEIYQAIERRFQETGHPRDLTLMHSAGQSDRVGGMTHWAHEGLLSRIIGSHWGLAPKMSEFISTNKVAAYCLPQGQITHLYRAIAGGKPGEISPIGLHTFVDPRLEGGRINDRARAGEALVQLVTLGGEEFLWYKPLHIDVAIMRGTTADDDGNVSCEDEGVALELLSLAQAARKCGGKVIVQVKRRIPVASLLPKAVVVPGILVDVVVVAADPQQTHRQTSGAFFNPAYLGINRATAEAPQAIALDERKIIGRRGALELRPGAIVNLGTGIPGDAVGPVAFEEQLIDKIKMTIESGTIGGVPAGGVDFGLASYPEAIIEHPYQFDFYNGGGVDIAYMGVGEIDQAGNVNVSKLAGRTPGCGGFIDITQPAKAVVFCGTFTSGGLEIAVENGTLRIIHEGKYPKFVERVAQVTYSSAAALARKQRVRYVLERAVFDLTPNGIRLIELAPGIDLEHDVLSKLPFRPVVAPHVERMPDAIFLPQVMGLLDRWRD